MLHSYTGAILSREVKEKKEYVLKHYESKEQASAAVTRKLVPSIAYIIEA
jgi:hypothetical protein